MSLADFSHLANHLWQSTLLVAVVWLLTLALRRNRAHVRYWLWLVASVKFLVPFAVFVAVGRQFRWPSTVSSVQPDVTFVIDTMSQPFSRPEVAAMASPITPSILAALPMLVLAVWFCGCAMHLLAWWVRWRRVAAIVRQASPVQSGRELDAVRRLERVVGIRRPIAVASSDTSLEPGIFGIRRPVLVWPRTIGQRLAHGQIDAILTHELCHVRRRDNLAAAIHMLVEAIFWFHPLVWWLEKRLVDERERACDEEVIRLGSEPQVYAESILRTCEFCVKSPLIVAGVTSSDLKKRVEAIMRGDAGARLTAWKKLVLATACVVAIVIPVAVGMLNTPPLIAQSRGTTDPTPQAFEVASVKSNRSGEQGGNLRPSPGGRVNAVNMPLFALITFAYQVTPMTLVGGPDWINNERFDIVAKLEGDSPPATPPSDIDHIRVAMRTLLADRFKLRVHRETRELDVYALVLARAGGSPGPALKRSAQDCSPEALRAMMGRADLPPRPGSPVFCGARMAPGRIQLGGMSLSVDVGPLGGQVGRIVVDRTGLTGNWDFELTFAPDAGRGSPAGNDLPPPDPNAPSIFTALQEQLGLKLESTKGPVEVLVIDGVEQPTPD